jgi:hypothetical protein
LSTTATSGLAVWLPLFGSLIQGIGLVAGVVVAYKGLNTWRRQRVDGRKIDIAEEALRGFARMQDILFGIAHGAVFAPEKQQIVTEFLKDFDEKERDRLATYAAPLFREQRYQAEIKEIFDQRYVCLAYFGKEAEKYFDDLREVLIDIRVAAQMLVTRDIQEPTDSDTRELYEELRKKIWMGSIENHPLHIKTIEAVDGATAFFGKELRSR